jgi:protocatechuate 4,5-dioxygenase beta chain
VATIVGAVATSHIPAIGKVLAKGLQSDSYWRPFFSGYDAVHAWLAEVDPDVAVVIYNDHGLNFFLDKMPTFAVGAAQEYCNADEGWGLSVCQPTPGYPELSWHVIESLISREFDITTCQELLVDHGFVVPLSLLWGEARIRPIRTVPIVVNTVQYPYPTPSRCFKFGIALGEAIQSFGEDQRVVLIGSGGLSHQLEGERAGFINPEFDLEFMQNIVTQPEVLTRYSTAELIRLVGSQGIEILNWLVMRGALNGDVRARHSHYHVPISNTAGATLVLESSGSDPEL